MNRSFDEVGIPVCHQNGLVMWFVGSLGILRCTTYRIIKLSCQYQHHGSASPESVSTPSPQIAIQGAVSADDLGDTRTWRNQVDSLILGISGTSPSGQVCHLFVQLSRWFYWFIVIQVFVVPKRFQQFLWGLLIQQWVSHFIDLDGFNIYDTLNWKLRIEETFFGWIQSIVYHSLICSKVIPNHYADYGLKRLRIARLSKYTHIHIPKSQKTLFSHF